MGDGFRTAAVRAGPVDYLTLPSTGITSVRVQSTTHVLSASLVLEYRPATRNSRRLHVGKHSGEHLSTLHDHPSTSTRPTLFDVPVRHRS
jgi:hypothetical protein